MFQRFHPGSSIVTGNISIIFSRHWNMQVTNALEVSKKVLASLHHLSHFFQLSIIFYIFGPLTVFSSTLKCALVPLPDKKFGLPEYFQGKCHIVTQSSAIKLISSLFSLISYLHWTVLSCHCNYSQNKVLTTVTKGGSMWLSGVRDRRNGVTVFLDVPLVDVRKSTGQVEETQQASLLWLKSMREWPRESLPTLTSGGESPEQLPTAIQHTKHMWPHAGGVLLPMRGWMAMAGFPWKTRLPWAQSLQKHDLYWQQQQCCCCPETWSLSSDLRDKQPGREN